MEIALITGGSRGLGLALARRLVQDGWGVVIDARGADELADAEAELSRLADPSRVVAIAGDVADAPHRRELIEAARRLGGLDLLVNNASILGPSPQPALADYPLSVLSDVFAINVTAPLALVQIALPLLSERGGRILNVTSDAAVEPYPGWGGYGSSKAALEQLSAVLASEQPGLHVWWVDPGDMRTRMHQEAFPGEDISDRPSPEEAAPALVELIRANPPSGRYRGADLAVRS